MSAPKTFNRFLQEIVEGGLERLGLYYSKYPGEVADNHDPEGRGRLRVACPSVYGQDVPDHWADPAGMAAVGVGSGLFDAPDIGDPVWVEFQGGRARYPLWSPGWWGRRDKTNEVPFPANKVPPTVKVWRTKAGQRIEMDTTPGNESVMIVSSDGSYVRWDAEQSVVQENVVGDKVVDVAGNLQNTIRGNVENVTQGTKTETVIGPTSVNLGSTLDMQVIGVGTFHFAQPVGVFAPLFTIVGNLSVVGNINATGAIIDQGGNTNNHSH